MSLPRGNYSTSNGPICKKKEIKTWPFSTDKEESMDDREEHLQLSQEQYATIERNKFEAQARRLAYLEEKRTKEQAVPNSVPSNSQVANFRSISESKTTISSQSKFASPGKQPFSSSMRSSRLAPIKSSTPMITHFFTSASPNDKESLSSPRIANSNTGNFATSQTSPSKSHLDLKKAPDNSPLSKMSAKASLPFQQTSSYTLNNEVMTPLNSSVEHIGSPLKRGLHPFETGKFSRVDSFKYSMTGSNTPLCKSLFNKTSDSASLSLPKYDTTNRMNDSTIYDYIPHSFNSLSDSVKSSQDQTDTDSSISTISNDFSFSHSPSQQSNDMERKLSFISDSTFKDLAFLKKKQGILSQTSVSRKSDDIEFNEESQVLSRYDFARNPQDISGRKPGDEEYNPTELLIPKKAWLTFSDVKKQYWKYKQYHFDEIVFFQQGDFFNLFGSDADIGLQRFGLTYNSKQDSVGINRRQIGEWAVKFINLGYKVTILSQRITATTDEDKLVKARSKETDDRLVTCRLTSGTINDLNMFEDDNNQDLTQYLMVIAEEVNSKKDTTTFGLNLIDTSTYEWIIYYFEDDSRLSQLETIILHTKPKEILYDRSSFSNRTLKLLDLNLNHPTYSFLPKFPNEVETIFIITEYFPDINMVISDTMETISPPSDVNLHIPDPIHACLKNINQSPSSQIALRALAASIKYLQQQIRSGTLGGDTQNITSLDKEIVTKARFFINDMHGDRNGIKYMTLDAISLSNLDILENNADGSSNGTLLKLLNRCVTPFGKRHMRRTLCRPLFQKKDIVERQDTVEFFLNNTTCLLLMRRDLQGLKDLERLLSKIASKTIPINFFIDFIDSIEKVHIAFLTMRKNLEDVSNQSGYRGRIPALLEKLVNDFPDLTGLLAFCKFDRVQARLDQFISPATGLNNEFDQCRDCIEMVTQELHKTLDSFRRQLHDFNINFSGGKTQPYLINITNSYTINSVPANWKLIRETKQGSRFLVPEISNLETNLNGYNSELDHITKSTLSFYLKQICTEYFDDCLQAVEITKNLDIILSLAHYSNEIACGNDFCRPELISYSDDSMENQVPLLSDYQYHNDTSPAKFDARIFIKKMRHPFIIPFDGTPFVPNDIQLGGSVGPILLIMGPNMGGKSTLLRQVCILTIMAQIGCFIPAESCQLTPIDRIFTRIGARDNIMAGQSTFLKELEETSIILHSATSYSLVILDELGRGTSTFDGYSIAYAVLKNLEQKKIRALFATHYHSLARDFYSKESSHDNHNNLILDSSSSSLVVQQAHMACHQEDGKMIFLYMLKSGSCSNSFGLEVAAMANIPHEILQLASEMSDKFESIILRRFNTQVQVLKREIFFKLIQIVKMQKIEYGTVHDSLNHIWKQIKMALNGEKMA